jgi:hypothetical protein
MRSRYRDGLSAFLLDVIEMHPRRRRARIQDPDSIRQKARAIARRSTRGEPDNQ